MTVTVLCTKRPAICPQKKALSSKRNQIKKMSVVQLTSSGLDSTSRLVSKCSFCIASCTCVAVVTEGRDPAWHTGVRARAEDLGTEQGRKRRRTTAGTHSMLADDAGNGEGPQHGQAFSAASLPTTTSLAPRRPFLHHCCRRHFPTSPSAAQDVDWNSAGDSGRVPNL